MTTEYVLGVDIGSGSVKLTLLSRQGEIAAVAGCEYQTFYPRPGWCEQEPEDWCRAFRQALGALLQSAQAAPKQIRALALDAATHTAVLLDEDKRVLRRAILWTDQRSKGQVQQLKKCCPELLRRQVCNAPTTVWTLPQLMWLRENEPETWKNTRYLLFANDYLRFCLTGTMETDTIDAAGSMFYDVQNQHWSRELCDFGEIPDAWLPRLCAPTEIAGTVTARAAASFGLAEGTMVLVGTTDTVMEVLAAGNVQPGHTTVKLATAGRICVVTDRPLSSPFLFNYRHVVPGLWYPGTATASCAASYRWFRDTIGREPFEQLNIPAEKIAPGCDGLLFHPYLNGEPTPYNDPNLRGSFTGISASHTAAHFTRATLEGVAMSLNDCLEVVAGLGVTMNRVHIIGGGAKGTLWRQIVSDVLGLTLEKVEVDDSSFGTATLAAVGLGWFTDFAQAAEYCVRINSVTYPDEENRRLYEAVFLRYKRIAHALKEIYDG